jgi:hypothetical protein
LQGGELDLQVDWEVRYYDWLDDTPQLIAESDLTDQPGPIVDLQDVKPGDVFEATLSAHVFDNPAFLGWHYEEHLDSDNGITEPEDKVDGHTPNDSDGDPFAAAEAGLGAGALGAVLPRRFWDRDDEDGEGGSGAGRLAGGAAAAGLGAAAVSGVASAESDPAPEKGDPADADGDQDVSIESDELAIDVGELNSSGWFYDPTGGGDPGNDGIATLFNETYAFQERAGGGGPVQPAGGGFELVSEADIVSPFPSSVSPGDTATATVEFPSFPAAGGTTTLTVDRKVTLDPDEPVVRIEYDIENTGGTDVDDLGFYQYVDYDIADTGNEVGRYFFDPDSQCEYIAQEDVAEFTVNGETFDGLFAGFTADRLSESHELSHFFPAEVAVEVGTLNGKDLHPDQDPTTDDCASDEATTCATTTEDGETVETDDVGLAFEWSLGALPAGESTTYRNSFVYNPEADDFQQEICEESPGEPPSEGDGELDDVTQCVIWYDDGNNVPEEIWTGETDLGDPGPDEDLDEETLEQYVMEVGEAQSPSEIVDTEAAVFTGTLDDLDGADVLFDARESIAGSVAEEFPETACYQNSDTEFVGVLCWVPRDIPGVNDNVIQTDRLEFQFGFDAVQCRHNVGDGGMPIDGTIDEADEDNNARSPGGDDGDDGDGVGPEETSTGDGFGKLEFGDGEASWFGRLRFGDGGPSGDGELYVGNDVGDRSQAQYDWGSDFQGSFTLSYDAAAGEATLALFDDGGSELASTTYSGLNDPASTGDGSADQLAVTTKARNAGNVAGVENVAIDGASVGPPDGVSSSADGPRYLLVEGVDVASDFELSADVEFEFADTQREDPAIDVTVD